MNDEFELLREVLSGQRPLPVDISLAEACNRRLLRAAVAGHGSRPGEADLAVLTRHALRREQEKQAGVSPTVAVPRTAPWPAPAAWELFGVEVVHATPTHSHLRSRPWTPAWLPDATRYPLDGPAAAEDHRRDYGEPLSGDPFLDPFEAWRKYRCAGQREAVRGVLTAPGGSTLVLNLPTGSGKSLCAYVPALIDPYGPERRCRPHDRTRARPGAGAAPRMSPISPRTTAAAMRRRRSGTGASAERVRDGTQRILFTSPESLVQSLAGPIYTAATQGSLRLLAVDEAHIIDQWGDDFRAEFQELAGLRQDLLRQSPGEGFKTVLLTGTMTESCLDILETLFGRPGPFSVVSAVQLRPEPSYWFGACPDEETRTERVFEALRHLPRPLILYVTKVADANTWLPRLHDAGFLRVAAVTGGTRPAERAEVVRAWQDGDIDLVVATSAFGLGMDKADVRAIVHACMPEHIDRFYQEVGRGGRDGRASVSLLLHAPEDREVARDLNQKTIITTEKGFERWKAMFFSREELADGRTRVPVDVVPEYGFGDFANSARNVAWNVHTLALLARSGVIDLDAQPPPRRDQFLGEDGLFNEELFLTEFQRHRNRRVIGIVDEAHLDLEAAWRGEVEKSRGRTARVTRRGLDLMADALTGQALPGGGVRRRLRDPSPGRRPAEAREPRFSQLRRLPRLPAGGATDVRRGDAHPAAGVAHRQDGTPGGTRAAPWDGPGSRPIRRPLGAGGRERQAAARTVAPLPRRQGNALNYSRPRGVGSATAPVPCSRRPSGVFRRGVATAPPPATAGGHYPADRLGPGHASDIRGTGARVRPVAHPVASGRHQRPGEAALPCSPRPFGAPVTVSRSFVRGSAYERAHGSLCGAESPDRRLPLSPPMQGAEGGRRPHRQTPRARVARPYRRARRPVGAGRRREGHGPQDGSRVRGDGAFCRGGRRGAVEPGAPGRGARSGRGRVGPASHACRPLLRRGSGRES